MDNYNLHNQPENHNLPSIINNFTTLLGNSKGRDKRHQNRPLSINHVVMQSVINSVKGTALGVAEFLTPVLKVTIINPLFYFPL